MAESNPLHTRRGLLEATKKIWDDRTMTSVIMFYHVAGTDDGTFYIKDRLMQPFRDERQPLRFIKLATSSLDQLDPPQDRSSFRCPIPGCASKFTQEGDWVEHIYTSHRDWWSLLGSIEARMMLVRRGRTKGNDRQIKAEFDAGTNMKGVDAFEKLYEFVIAGTSRTKYSLIGVALWQACRFYRTIPVNPGGRRSLPMDRITTTLPIALQLTILDNLEIHQADRVVRETYPHLIDRWCSSLATRFTNWFFELSSRDNLRFMGVIDGIDSRVEIFRLRYIDLRPTLQVDEPYSPTQAPGVNDPLRQFYNVPALDRVREALFDCFYIVAASLRKYSHDAYQLGLWRQENDNKLVWWLFMRDALRSLLNVVTIHPYISPYAGISLENALREVFRRAPTPFLFPLAVHHVEDDDKPGSVVGDGDEPPADDGPDDNGGDEDGDEDEDGNGDGDGNGVDDEQYSKGVSYLLLYPDELETIVRNFEVMIRPDQFTPDKKTEFKMACYLRMGMLAQCFMQEGAAGSVRSGAPFDLRFNDMLGRMSDVWEEIRARGDWLGAHL